MRTPIRPGAEAAPDSIAFSELVVFHERQIAPQPSAPAPNWTALLGLSSLPPGDAKRVELVELAALLERYDVLEAAAATDPSAGVRASARRALPLVPA